MKSYPMLCSRLPNSRGLAMHVTEHDDINAAAQERADTAIWYSGQIEFTAHRRVDYDYTDR